MEWLNRLCTPGCLFAKEDDLPYTVSSYQRIRHYLKSFYISGKPRSEYIKKPAYDSILPIIDIWCPQNIFYSIGNKDEKRYFFKMDSRDLDLNPFAIFLKSKSTNSLRNDLILYFIIPQILKRDTFTPISQIISDVQNSRLATNTSSSDIDTINIDAKRIRNVIKEMNDLGLLEFKKNKNAFLYRLADAPPNLVDIYPAIRLFSEISPLGLLGYYLIDRMNIQTDAATMPQIFTFKNRYLNHILDSQILETLFDAIHTQQAVQVYITARLDLHAQTQTPNNFTIEKNNKDAYRTALVLPFKIYVSVMTGARYLMGIYPNSQELACIRIEHIEHAELKASENALDHNALYTRFQQLTRNIWGVSSKNQSPTHVEMTITEDLPNGYMLTRLKTECRCSSVEQLSDTSARFSADICDARELFPWMRTFVGYISDVSFSDATLQELFIAQINELSDKYEI